MDSMSGCREEGQEGVLEVLERIRRIRVGIVATT